MMMLPSPAFLRPIVTRGANRATLARIAADLQSLAGPAPEPVLLSRWLEDVELEYRSRARSTRTRMNQALRESVVLAGTVPTTAALTPDLVARLAARPGRAATTNGLLSSLRAACRFAARPRQGYVDLAALEGASWRVPPDPPRRRHHGRAEISRVLEQLGRDIASWENHRLYAIACVWAYAGVRKREGLRLRVEDIDLERGFLFITRNGGSLKTPGSEAPVPCPAALVQVLRGWLPRCGSEWAFPGLKGRGAWLGGMAGKTAGARLSAAGRAAGVSGFTPQSLRHSLATHLAGHWGLSREQVRMVLRHTDSATTVRHYIHDDLVNLGQLVRNFTFTGVVDQPSRRRSAPRTRPRVLPRRRLGPCPTRA